MGATNSSLTGHVKDNNSNNSYLKNDVSVPITNLYTGQMKGESGTKYDNLIYVKGKAFMWFIKYNSQNSDSYTLRGTRSDLILPVGYYAAKKLTQSGNNIIGREHVK